MDLTEDTDQYVVDIRKSYDELILIENQIKTMDPSDVRQNYDKYWDIVNEKEIEYNEEKEHLDVAINNLEDGKELVDKISEIIQNIKTIINSLRVGTLQGITRQTIKENNIIPEPNDEIAKTILDQPYNELEDINRNKGGTKKYRKKYNRKRKSKSKSKRKRSKKYK